MDENSSLGHKPDGKWSFDQTVADIFDDMLNRSIPYYSSMRSTVFDIGRRYVKPGTYVIDLGCSRGEALAPFVGSCPTANFAGFEISEPMLEAARARFKLNRNVAISKTDLRDGLPTVGPVSVALSVLTLQFVPIEYRQGLVGAIYDALVPGGACILVEKVLGECGPIDATLVGAYYDLKMRNGYSNEEIQRKRFSLEGVLVPVTAKWNEELLRSNGFRQVECIWRCLNFAAWLAVK